MTIKKTIVKPVSEHRRITKPIMEKRRRARINNCLDQMKCLILEAMNKDPARNTKLEKADILEMTVSYLKNLQPGQQKDPMDRFRQGFSECAAEVTRFVQKAQGIDITAKQNLLSYLSNCVANSADSVTSSTLTTKPAVLNLSTGPMNLTTDLNNNVSSIDAEMTTPPSSASSSCHFIFPANVKSESDLPISLKDLSFAHWKFAQIHDSMWRPW